MEAMPLPSHVPPDHVPPELVLPYPMIMGAFSDENPHLTIIPKLHEGPEAFYSLHAYPGLSPAWIFRKARDLNNIYMDTEHFSSKGFSPFAMLLGETWQNLPAEADPPEHAGYRALMNPLFQPRKMAAMDARVRATARAEIAKFKDKGECEFMADFAFRFPIIVFLELMDLPLARVDEFLEWEMMLLHTPSLEVMAKGSRLVKDYLLGVIAERRAKPGDDFISYVVHAEIKGRPLTDDEIYGLCFNLYIGGLDTVSTNMGLHFRHLADHPEHQTLLRQDPSLIPNAMEELLRVYAAVATFRTCVKPIVVNGVQIMPGDKIAMSTFLANSDPDAFENPSEVKLDRAPRHITFGTGIHRCVGAPLARREMVIAMEEFLATIPDFRIKPGETVSTSLGGMIQPVKLPLSWAK